MNKLVWILFLLVGGLSSCSYFSSGVVALSKSSSNKWTGKLVSPKWRKGKYMVIHGPVPLEHLSKKQQDVVDFWGDLILMKNLNGVFIPFSSSVKEGSTIIVEGYLDYCKIPDSKGMLMLAEVLVVEQVVSGHDPIDIE